MSTLSLVCLMLQRLQHLIDLLDGGFHLPASPGQEDHPSLPPLSARPRSASSSLTWAHIQPTYSCVPVNIRPHRQKPAGDLHELQVSPSSAWRPPSVTAWIPPPG